MKTCYPRLEFNSAEMNGCYHDDITCILRRDGRAELGTLPLPAVWLELLLLMSDPDSESCWNSEPTTVTLLLMLCQTHQGFLLVMSLLKLSIAPRSRLKFVFMKLLRSVRSAAVTRDVTSSDWLTGYPNRNAGLLEVNCSTLRKKNNLFLIIGP